MPGRVRSEHAGALLLRRRATPFTRWIQPSMRSPGQVIGRGDQDTALTHRAHRGPSFIDGAEGGSSIGNRSKGTTKVVYVVPDAAPGCSHPRSRRAGAARPITPSRARPAVTRCLESRVRHAKPGIHGSTAVVCATTLVPVMFTRSRSGAGIEAGHGHLQGSTDAVSFAVLLSVPES